MMMDQPSVQKKSRFQIQFHILLKICFGLTLVSSNDIITIKLDVKNHMKINNYLKKFKWAVKWTKGKRTQIMRWKKDNLQIKNVL